MIQSISRRWWLALLGLLWIGVTSPAQAWDPFVKVSNLRVNFHVEVNSTPRIPPPTAPWYAYFPTDARMMAPPNMSPYPPYPPPMPPAANGASQSRDPRMPAGPMLTQHWPSYYQPGSSVQPVGYAPALAPSYWYQGRCG